MHSVSCLLLWLTAVTQAAQPARDEHEFTQLRDAYVARFRPAFLESQAAWWEASVTGTDAAFARKTAAEKALVDLHSDRAVFAQLKALKERGNIRDPQLRRELDVLYRTFLPGQADPTLQKRIVELEAQVEQIFNTFRSRVGDRTLTENDVREILATSADSAAVEAAWNAYMEVGARAAPVLAELVRLRNQMARELGFVDFFTLQLELQELDAPELFRLYEELDRLTREPFAEWKRNLDRERATRFGIPEEELRPWHFGDLFFQEVPPTADLNLDAFFRDADLTALCRAYYAGIGLPVDDILDRSDLFEKPGKCPHAFCVDLDRGGDIRVLANLKPNAYWADTLLHELGHGVYDKYIRRDVPFLLHEAAHGITTEGTALLFGALIRNEEWLARVLHADAERVARVGPALRASLRTERLMFARWAQVMLHFEKGMYADPDQDLGRLWWELKQRYQLLRPPESVSRPDYAAKVHILTHPVYYQNYMLGECFAAQVRHHIARKVLHLPDTQSTSFFGRPEAGQFLREKVFGPGNLYSWNELTKLATGEPLTARFFAEALRE